MAKKIGLLDEVMQRLPSPNRRRWIDGVPPDVCGELGQVKEQFRGGLMGQRVSANGLAKALSETLADRGIQVHQTTLVRWLNT